MNSKNPWPTPALPSELTLPDPYDPLDPPQRFQLSRKKGSRLPVKVVRCVRGTRYGNPYVVGPDQTASEAVTAYVACLAGWEESKLIEFLTPLRGKHLACWCKIGDPCHADALLYLANR